MVCADERLAGPVTFRPNPAPAGTEVEISYEGKLPLLYQSPGDREWKPVPLDPKTGKGRLRVPLGTPLLVFTDEQVPSLSAELRVVDSVR